MTPFEPEKALPLKSPPALAGDRGAGELTFPPAPRDAEAGEEEGAARRPALSPALSFGNLLKALRRRWAPALAAGATLGFSLAAAVWFLLPPQYTAYALLRVASADPQLLPDNKVTFDNENNFENTQVALLKSRPILQSRPATAQGGRARDGAGAPDPVAWLEDDLKAGFLEKTDLIKVSLTGDNPNEVAVLVNAVKDAYLDEGVNAQRNQKPKLFDNLEEVYQASEDKIRTPARRAPPAGRRPQVRRLRRRLSAKQKMALDEYAAMRREQMLLQSQMRNAESALAVEKARAEAAAGADGPSLPDSLVDQAVESDPLVLKKKLEIDQIEAKAAQAARAYNPGQGPLAKYEAELRFRRGGAEKAERRAPGGRRGAGRRQAAVGAGGEGPGAAARTSTVWRRKRRNLKGKWSAWARRRRRSASPRSSWSCSEGRSTRPRPSSRGCAKKWIASRSSCNRPASASACLTPAEVPTKPDSGVRTRSAAFAGAAGLLLGLFGVSYWEARGRRIRTKEEVAGELGLRVVGTLPALRGRPALEAPTGGRRGAKVADPAAVWASSVESIRASILCHAEDEPGCRALLVTSALAREGKTTLACHLALSLALAGHRTLLVDCDSRRPQLHRVFGTPAGPGLSEVLGGDLDLAGAVHAGPVEGLSVLPIGRELKQVSQALVRRKMRQLLEEARAGYDFILLDCSPVLPVADALALGRLVDGVLLSVRPGLSQFPHVSGGLRTPGGPKHSGPGHGGQRDAPQSEQPGVRVPHGARRPRDLNRLNRSRVSHASVDFPIRPVRVGFRRPGGGGRGARPAHRPLGRTGAAGPVRPRPVHGRRLGRDDGPRGGVAPLLRNRRRAAPPLCQPRATAQTVTLFLTAGRAGPLVAEHTPESCYMGAGFACPGPVVRQSIAGRDGSPAPRVPGGGFQQDGAGVAPVSPRLLGLERRRALAGARRPTFGVRRAAVRL